ncbi:unnamed protein product [Ectocarpus sp. 4 AP-2014]
MLIRMVFGSLGVVAMVTLYTSVAKLDGTRESGPAGGADFKEPAPPAGFRYDTEADPSRGDAEQLQKPPATSPPRSPPPPPPPPPPPRPPLDGEDEGGQQGGRYLAGGGGHDGGTKKEFIKRGNDDRNRSREDHAKAKKKFHRFEKVDISSEDSIRNNYVRGGWMGGLGLGIDAYVGDGSWDAELSADPAAGEDDVSRRRPVIINADEEGGGDGQVRWEPGQLSRLAQRQQRQRDEEDEEEGGMARTPMLGPDAVLLVICADRPEYLERTLKAVAEYHPGSSRGASFAIPVVISQDGSSSAVEEVISRFKTSMAGRAHVTHIHHTPARRENRPYFKLSAHYEWALSQVFDELFQTGYSSAAVDKVIILEEDLEIAPDFFEYFSAMAPLLDSDETLMAVSAWNDNGQAAHDNTALFRSDFFPGLGWMLPRRVWDELAADWPEAYWDDWLRDPRRRKGRQFVRPEVCRTYHFGQKAGASRNQFSQLLNNIRLNEEAVPFREMDVSYLMPDAFRSWLDGELRDARAETVANVKAGRALSSEVVVEYGSEREFASLARQLGIMDDTKAQVPRTAYMGVVFLWVGETKVYLAPRDAMSRLRR